MSKLHLIGNAHLDPVWLWRWQEGFSEVMATYRSALDRMKDFDDFKFTSACAVYYEWIEKIDPEMFNEIKQRVKEGRWNIVGGWYLQPDCNIPDGESFARHALISQRYFKEKFGIMANTGYNVDSFGHNANLPKILKASGMDNYVFMRPSPEEQGRDDSVFKWESDDETQINAYRIPLSYCIESARMDVGETIQKIKEKSETENMDLMAFYGVGNHGGGPTISLINEIKQLNLDNMIFSTPDEYFSQINEKNLPVIKDELQHHARGCYSAEAYVKSANRKCEQNLIATEKLCTMAKELTGSRYPAKKLKKAWKNLIFNQFHDILCGCSIKKAYEDASYLFGEIMSITEQEMNIAMQKISWNIDTLKGEVLPSYKDKNYKIWEHEVLGTPVVVFNTNTWMVTDCIAINQNVTKITDCNGDEIPLQKVRGDQSNLDDKYHTAFMAKVPAMGYAVYRIYTEKPSNTVFENELKVTEKILENSKIRVKLSGLTGDICSFYDKESDQYIINKPCAAILLDEADCDTWAHDRTSFGDIVNLGEKVGMFEKPEFKIIERGKVRTTIRVTSYYNNSVLTRDYTIYAGKNNVDIKTKVDFREKHKTLKFTFPMAGEKVTAKIPYGTITRCGYTGEEPFGSWLASGKLCVANDSKYGYDTEDNEMRMTVLRSAIYADHYAERDEFCEYMEQGTHEFKYALFPYKNNADSERRASELNTELKYTFGCFHNGNLPETFTSFECDNENIIVSAIKQSEDEHYNIIRFYEMNGENVSVSLKLFGKEISANVPHNSVKTYNSSGTELNMLEESM